MNIEDVFSKSGNFKKPIDPYRCSKNNKIYKYLFDNDGYAIRITEALNFINKYNCGSSSDIVRYYNASNIDYSCGGLYTAIYAWR